MRSDDTVHSQTHITGGFSQVGPSAYTTGKGRGVDPCRGGDTTARISPLGGSLHLFPSWRVGTHKPWVHTRSIKSKLLPPRRVWEGAGGFGRWGGAGILLAMMRAVTMVGRERRMDGWITAMRTWEEWTVKNIFSHRWLKRNTENGPQHLIFLADCRQGGFANELIFPAL